MKVQITHSYHSTTGHLYGVEVLPETPTELPYTATVFQFYLDLGYSLPDEYCLAFDINPFRVGNDKPIYSAKLNLVKSPEAVVKFILNHFNQNHKP